MIFKRKNFKKVRYRKNKKGYWERGGASETEFKIAIACLTGLCVMLGIAILNKIAVIGG